MNAVVIMKSRGADGIGQAIRKLRIARGWTLAELSTQCGVPLSTLSRVELGQNALNYEKLVRLCKALEVDLQGLVAREVQAAPVASGRRAIARAGDGEAVRMGQHAGRKLAADLIAKSLSPTVIDLKAGDIESHGAMRTLAGEAFLMVLNGEVVLHSQIYAPLTLATGDSIYFDARAEHAITSPEGGQILLVLAGEESVDSPV